MAKPYPRPNVSTLPYLDDCQDHDLIQPYYRIRGSDLIIAVETEGLGYLAEVYALVGSSQSWTYLQGPSYALNSQFHGAAADRDLALRMADWVRRTIRKVDE